jgi:hypothetical protein
MMQEIEVTAVIKLDNGDTITEKYTDEINAAYRTKFIRNKVRSDLYMRFTNLSELISLKIREEAEIYENLK